MSGKHDVVLKAFYGSLSFCTILLLVYVVYRAPLYPRGLFWTYVTLGMGGLVVWLLLLRGPSARQLNVALLLCATGAGLYMAEGILYVLNREDVVSLRIEAAERTGRPYDARTPGEVVDSLRRVGMEAYARMAPIVFDNRTDLPLYPLGVKSRTRIVTCNENGFFQTYISDRYGFKNPPGSWQADAVDLVLIGDSFAHGFCVAEDETLANRLRAHGFDVINLAHPGNSPLIELGTLKEYAARLRPEVVFWLYYEGNDLSGLLRDFRHAQLAGYLDSTFTQNLMERQPEVDRLYLEVMQDSGRRSAQRGQRNWRQRIETLNGLLRLERLRGRLMSALGMSVDPTRNLLYRSGTAPQPSTGRVITPLADVLQSAQQTTATWGGRLYFVYLPDYQRYAFRVNHDAFYARRAVLDTVLRMGIPVIDLHEKVFRKQTDPRILFPFGYFGHYNAEGYRLTTEALLQALHDSTTPAP